MSSNGTKINTFVFFDTETTGLPEYEFNRTRITELTMIAAGRDHLMECDKTVLPRVLHKLTLCINPRKLITSTEITGYVCSISFIFLLYNCKAFLYIIHISNTYINII